MFATTAAHSPAAPHHRRARGELLPCNKNPIWRRETAKCGKLQFTVVVVAVSPLDLGQNPPARSTQSRRKKLTPLWGEGSTGLVELNAECQP